MLIIHLGRWGRLTTMAGLLALLYLVAVPFASQQVQAASSPTSLAHQIDWQHPFHINLGRSGVGSSRTGDVVSTTQASPNANFPGGCYNGVAYNVVVGGRTYWTATAGAITAWVEYQWCPLFAGDGIGKNWSYGRAYVKGCATIYVGDLNDPFHNPIGPQLVAPGGAAQDDDEFLTSYKVCNGYAWDYSTTAIGSGTYKVFMFAQSDGNVLAIAESPCFC